jgi:hypothetical protein
MGSFLTQVTESASEGAPSATVILDKKSIPDILTRCRYPSSLGRTWTAAMGRRIELFDRVGVRYATDRSREIQYCDCDVSIEIELPVVALGEFEPLYRKTNGDRTDVGGYFIRDGIIYRAVMRHHLELRRYITPGRELPRGARPINDDRSAAVARLRQMVEGAIATEEQVLVPSPPIYPRLVIGFGGFRLEQFSEGSLIREYSGFATNRMAGSHCRDHFDVQLPFNLFDSYRTRQLVAEVMRLRMSRAREHLIENQWMDLDITRPDLIPRHSEAHAAAVTACLMAAASVQGSGVTSDHVLLEYAAEMVRHADCAILGIANFEAIAHMLDELPSMLMRGDGHMMLRWERRAFLEMCRLVIRRGDILEFQPSAEILDQYSGTDAYAEWLLKQAVDTDPDVVAI